MVKATQGNGSGNGSIRKTVILVDLDCVVFDANWREPMIASAGWDDYHAAGKDDKPIEVIVDLLTSLGPYYYFVGVTGRPEKWRKLSMDGLVRHRVMLHELLMRPDGDFRPAPEIKVALVKEHLPNYRDEVAFIMDDREDVAAAFKAIGITALQVHAVT